MVQFVESQHTPRNTMLRAILSGSPVRGGEVRAEYDEMVAAWSVTPKLAELLEQGVQDACVTASWLRCWSSPSAWG